MNAILQWLYNNTPGFMRPAVGWLIEGLRRITMAITGVWNWLGVSVGRWHLGVVAWVTHAAEFARTVQAGLAWFKNVWIPHAISVVRDSVVSFVRYIDRELRNLISAGLSTLRRWAEAAVNAVRSIVDAVQRFVDYWIGRIRSTVDALISAAKHVLEGPDRLAEWLVGAMIRALTRHLLSQGERIARWLLSSSPAFTLWLARETEAILTRILR